MQRLDDLIEIATRHVTNGLYCKPVSAKAVPTGSDWIHEVKYDGYRRRIVRDGRDVKRSGLDWTWRFPWIVETALKMRQSRTRFR